MNITKFKDTVSKTGLARANRFTVEINPPSGLSVIGASILNQSYKGGNFALPTLGDFDLADLVDIDANLSFGPIGINLGVNGTLEKLELYCKTAQIPSRDMENFDFTYYGEKRQAAINHLHSSFTTGFFSSEDLRERRFFEAWQDLMFDPETKKSSYYDRYVGSVTIKKWDTSWQNVTAIYEFKEAYPTNIGTLDLDQQNGDTLQLDITWNYRNYVRKL